MTYKKVLVTVNVYEDTSFIINSALSFAKKNNVNQLDVVTVIDYIIPFAPTLIDLQSNMEEHAQKVFEELKPKFEGFNTTMKVLVGNPHTEIIEFVKEGQYDLLIIGSHDKPGLNVVLGSTTNTILHKIESDVLVLRIQEHKSTSDMNYKNLVVPVDLEDDSQIVLNKAKEVRDVYNGKINLIFVIPDNSMGLLPIEKDKVEAQLKALSVQQFFVGKTKVEYGNVATAITNWAGEENTDLIVIGSHCRGAIGRFFLGSTANAVLHRATKDILVVRLKK